MLLILLSKQLITATLELSTLLIFADFAFNAEDHC
jgi:hypothetical protein